MKKLYFVIIIILNILFVNYGYSQIVGVGGCDLAKVEFLGSTPNYDNNLYFYGYQSCHFTNVNGCSAQHVACSPAVRQYRLERFQNGGWTVVASWQDITVFNNQTVHGVYRIAYRTPVIRHTENCPGTTLTKVFDYAGKHVGFIGEWSDTEYTNSFVIGETVQSDISWQFLDMQGGNAFTTGFDDDEDVWGDFTACKNYTSYFMAIFELNGPQRYTSTGGWVDEQIGQFRIQDLYTDRGWDFLEGGEYTVQFALVNKDCPTDPWINLNRTFFICPAGTGCKGLEDEAYEISINPNPAVNYLRIDGLGNIDSDNIRLNIFSLGGKKMYDKNLNFETEINVSELENGFYILVILDENSNKVIYKDKLVIQK